MVSAQTPSLWQDELSSLSADVSILEELARNHARQWTLEDRSRCEGLSDAARATVKIEIDACNAARHRAIGDFDLSLDYPQPLPAARPISETPGEMADRLLILELKIAHARSHESRQLFLSWHSHLRECLTLCLRELAAGEVRLPPRTSLKLYRAQMPESPAQIAAS